MNSLEFAPVSRLLPSPHELQVRLDSLRKLSNDCRTIVDEAPFSQERKEYISMLIEEKITFAEHLSGIEGSSIYLKRLLENLLRLQEVGFSFSLLRRIATNHGNVVDTFWIDFAKNTHAILQNDSLMEGIHAEVYQRVLLEHEEHARMYATNIDVSKDIIAAVEKMESGIYTPNAEGRQVQRALSTLQNSLSNAIEKPAIRLNRVVKADARINPFLLALMSESPEKILRMLDIDIPDTIDPFLTFLIVLREDPRIVNQIIRKWDDKNMVSATQEVIIANEEDTKEIPSFVPYSETVQTEKTRRNMSGMLMSILGWRSSKNPA